MGKLSCPEGLKSGSWSPIRERSKSLSLPEVGAGFSARRYERGDCTWL